MNDNDNIKARILVVDDTEDNLDLICEVFEDLPYEIVRAQNAEQALSVAQSERLDLAILACKCRMSTATNFAGGSAQCRTHDGCLSSF